MSGPFKKAGFPTAKKPDGTPTLICLDDQGRVPTTDQTPGVCVMTPFACVPLTASGDPLESDSVLIGEVTINPDKDFGCAEWSVYSNFDVLWTIYRVDDAAGANNETVVHQMITNPAHPSDCCKIECMKFNTDTLTDTKLRLKAEAINPECLGPAMGFVAFKELAD